MASLLINLSKLHLYLALVILFFSTRLIISDTKYILVKSACFGVNLSLKAQYTRNLKRLLSSLPEKAGQSVNNGYYTTNTTDWAASDSETIYAVFLCQGDITSDDCKGCVSVATDEIQPQCWDAKGAVIWYDKCMVRYSNKTFQGEVDEVTIHGWKNNEDVSTLTNDVDGFQKLAGNTLNDLAIKLGDSEDNPRLLREGARRYYLTRGDVPVNSFIRLYTMAQCTPDLEPVDCQKCLNIIINEMAAYCNGSKGGRMLNPSCNTRYEVYRFYVDMASPPPLTPLSPPPKTASSPPAPTKDKNHSGQSIVVNTTLAALVLILAILVIVLVYFQCKKRKENNDVENIRNYDRRSHARNFENVGEDFMTAESLQYDFATLKFATNNFSDINKLGEGGFGIVYKGILPNGQEIAVKRLSKDSNQGEEQFKNEVVFVAKLQHKNLVGLLGFFITDKEKLLVYEFVRNTSLDVILFDPETQGLLDWSTRYKIIHGIARGILYLHEDSRLKIVHRDLKASNILLDADMNPKISDFGLARNFAVNQEQDQTSRLAGTMGYMAPEYLEYGEISTKSDVYSFGVLVLEIISGKKISTRQTMLAENLPTYVWRHWREGTALEVVDASLEDSYSSSEVVRCLQLGLLCVQGDVEERPSMLSIVAYLNSRSDLPMPQKPASFMNSIRKGPNSGTKDLTDRSTKSGSSFQTSGNQSGKSSSRSIHSFSGVESSS